MFRGRFIKESVPILVEGRGAQPSSESGRFVAVPSYVLLSVSSEKREVGGYGSLRTVRFVSSLLFASKQFAAGIGRRLLMQIFAL